MTVQWVQHMSGQGEKWEVRDGVTSEHTWAVRAKHELGGYHWLPKSEFRLCDPPEVWEDVTGECTVIKPVPGISDNFIGGIGSTDSCVLYGPTFHARGYRLRKVLVDFIGSGEPNGCRKGVAFIVEKKA